MPATMTLVNRKPNANTAWIEHPSGWTGYVFAVILLRLLCAYIPVISSETAWTITNISHNMVRPLPPCPRAPITPAPPTPNACRPAARPRAPRAGAQITLLLFHLTKGTPFDDDTQGKTRTLTFWEQIDGGVQFSATRKVLTAVPVILYVARRARGALWTRSDASHGERRW